MKLPNVRRALFFLFHVSISPPLRPPPNKTVSSLSKARAGPREFPPWVTDLAIGCDEIARDTELSEKSAALADGNAPRSRAEIRRILGAMPKTLSCGPNVSNPELTNVCLILGALERGRSRSRFQGMKMKWD
jgi:hypothetical protein